MSHPDEAPGKVVPAQLNFLAIYNPDLVSARDEDVNEQDQIVFFHSRTARQRSKRRNKSADDAADSSDAVNEQLRHVGLAQGMVAFARGFSNGQPVDSVDTEKRRVVLKELETGWWILASIDLTRLPRSRTGSDQSVSTPSFDYSAREVSPPALLLQQLQCAYRIFLLHHSQSLSDLFVHLTRAKFCDLIDCFWTKFALRWDVLLHGNPSVDVYGGIKVAAGGELGIGVGEEDWGSAERDILEGLIRNTDGLVDLTVSRFGDPINDVKQTQKPTNRPRPQKAQAEDAVMQQWMGNGQDPGPSDGMIFSGIGALTRPALRAITDWVTSIYVYGEDAYGVQDNPSSSRRRRNRRKPQNTERESPDLGEPDTKVGVKQEQKPSHKDSDSKRRLDIPPPIVSTVEEPLKEATVSAKKKQAEPRGEASSHSQRASSAAFGSSEQWVKYLTLGYGSIWGTAPKPKTDDQLQTENSLQASNSTRGVKNSNISSAKGQTTTSGESRKAKSTSTPKARSPSGGYFVVGLQGDLDAEDEPNYVSNDDVDAAANDEGDWSSRISLRTLHVQMSQTPVLGKDAEDEPQELESPAQRLRAVIYSHPPFIYTLLFDPSCISISFTSYFHDLHHHLTPLHGPLLKSTSPTTVTSRLQSALSDATCPIFDVVHSSQSLATHCSIPNIPSPGTLAAEGLPNVLSSTPASTAPSWSRLEALNVHSQILSTYVDTRTRFGERERTVKTGRGWWVVWMRVPTTSSSSPDGAGLPPVQHDDTPLSEAILVRKASNHLHPRHGWMGGGSAGASVGRRVGYGASAFGRLVGRESSGPGGGPDASVAAGAGSSGRLAEGIGLGVEPRRYVEVLLSLCR